MKIIDKLSEKSTIFNSRIDLEKDNFSVHVYSDAIIIECNWDNLGSIEKIKINFEEFKNLIKSVKTMKNRRMAGFKQPLNAEGRKRLLENLSAMEADEKIEQLENKLRKVMKKLKKIERLRREARNYTFI